MKPGWRGRRRALGELELVDEGKRPERAEHTTAPPPRAEKNTLLFSVNSMSVRLVVPIREPRFFRGAGGGGQERAGQGGPFSSQDRCSRNPSTRFAKVAIGSAK